MYLKVSMSYLLCLFSILNACNLTGNTGEGDIRSKSLAEENRQKEIFIKNDPREIYRSSTRKPFKLDYDKTKEYIILDKISRKFNKRKFSDLVNDFKTNSNPDESVITTGEVDSDYSDTELSDQSHNYQTSSNDEVALFNEEIKRQVISNTSLTHKAGERDSWVTLYKYQDQDVEDLLYVRKYSDPTDKKRAKKKFIASIRDTISNFQFFIKLLLGWDNYVFDVDNHIWKEFHYSDLKDNLCNEDWINNNVIFERVGDRIGISITSHSYSSIVIDEGQIKGVNRFWLSDEEKNITQIIWKNIKELINVFFNNSNELNILFEFTKEFALLDILKFVLEKKSIEKEYIAEEEYDLQSGYKLTNECPMLGELKLFANNLTLELQKLYEKWISNGLKDLNILEIFLNPIGMNELDKECDKDCQREIRESELNKINIRDIKLINSLMLNVYDKLKKMDMVYRNDHSMERWDDSIQKVTTFFKEHFDDFINEFKRKRK